MKNQNEIALEALKKGKTLDMLSMLYDYGIGNHTAVIARCRKLLEDEGNGESIVTEWRVIRSRKTGRKVKYATYYMPTRKKDNSILGKIKEIWSGK